MKKIATYYFIALALFNVWYRSSMTDVWKYTHHFYLQSVGGRDDLSLLPDATRLVIEHSWWPHIIAALSLIGAILSLATSFRSSSLCHAVIALLVVDVIMLSLTLIVYLMPFDSGTRPLSP